ncbi:MAG: hypothetical protein AAB215_03970 [Planctomycetota bacterium]
MNPKSPKLPASPSNASKPTGIFNPQQVRRLLILGIGAFAAFGVCYTLYDLKGTTQDYQVVGAPYRSIPRVYTLDDVSSADGPRFRSVRKADEPELTEVQVLARVQDHKPLEREALFSLYRWKPPVPKEFQRAAVLSLLEGSLKSPPGVPMEVRGLLWSLTGRIQLPKEPGLPQPGVLEGILQTPEGHFCQFTLPSLPEGAEVGQSRIILRGWYLKRVYVPRYQKEDAPTLKPLNCPYVVGVSAELVPMPSQLPYTIPIFGMVGLLIVFFFWVRVREDREHQRYEADRAPKERAKTLEDFREGYAKWQKKPGKTPKPPAPGGPSGSPKP